MTKLRTLARQWLPNAMTPPTDQQLIQALKEDQSEEGQTEALGQLYDRHASLVYNLALRLLRDTNEAEDLTQEIFIALPDLFDSQRGSITGFLSMLTRSRAIDRLRKRSNRQQILNRWQHALDSSTSTPVPFEQASIAERRERVQQALAQLPEKYRQVLEMSYYQGLSQSEISQRLDKPLGTVKSWARRGLLQLEKNLQDFFKEDEDCDAL